MATVEHKKAPRLTVTCVVCLKQRWRDLHADLPRKPLCASCKEKVYVLYSQERGRVRRHIPNAAERATAKERAAAFEKALHGGMVYEQIVALLRGKRPVGRPQPLVSDFAIELMFACGFSDAWITWELDRARREGELVIPGAGPPPLSENYVRRRRRLSLLPMSEAMRQREREFEREFNSPGVAA
jgi:hypothetical protein